MKKLIVLVLFSSCVGAFVVNSRMGMTSKEFQEQNMGENLVYAQDNITVYKMYSGSASGYLFYYFVNDKLTKIDAGAPTPNVRIEIQK